MALRRRRAARDARRCMVSTTPARFCAVVVGSNQVVWRPARWGNAAERRPPGHGLASCRRAAWRGRLGRCWCWPRRSTCCADKQRQPAEHLLLGGCLSGGGQDSAQPVGAVWVEVHHCSFSHDCDGAWRDRAARRACQWPCGALATLPTQQHFYLTINLLRNKNVVMCPASYYSPEGSY